jgi:transcription elongation factor GreA
VINGDDVKTDCVRVGAKVSLEDLEFNEIVEYTIVGSTEADPEANLISNESPLGVAILGKRRGEICDVNTPSGVARYKILSIKKK